MRRDVWPYRPEELAFKAGYHCRCGAPFASIKVACLTLTACAAVLTGAAKGSADCHYREQPDSGAADDEITVGTDLQTDATVWALVPV